jgi:adenosylcobyric acid synthase
MAWFGSLPSAQPSPANGRGSKTIAVIAYPRISNLDEFQPLAQLPGVRLRWVRTPHELAGADWIVLPGSKHTSSDLAWLRAQGLDRAIAAHAEQGGAVLGICGGLQMLGEALVDPHGIDGNGPGLGLLPLVTAFEPDKVVTRTEVAFGDRDRPVGGALAAAGARLRDPPRPHRAASGDGGRPHRAAARPGLAERRRQRAGRLPARAVRGPGVQQALFGATTPSLESVFDGLADFVEAHVAASVLDDLIR